MPILRCIKSKDILNSDQRTNYLKSKNLYISACSSGSNDQFIKNSHQYLIATNSYENRYNISKGHNLVQTQCSKFDFKVNPHPKGKLNEGNFLNFNNNFKKFINSTTAGAKGHPNSIYPNIDNVLSESDPLQPPFTNSLSKGPLSIITRWDASGVFVDPNRIYVNKDSCKDLIYLKDSSGNNYYDLSNNSISLTDYKELIINNNQLINYSLITKISLKNLVFI